MHDNGTFTRSSETARPPTVVACKNNDSNGCSNLGFGTDRTRMQQALSPYEKARALPSAALQRMSA